MSCRVGKAIGRAGACVEVVVSGDGAGGLNRGLRGGLGGSLGGVWADVWAEFGRMFGRMFGHWHDREGGPGPSCLPVE